ncbi:MAG: Xaa-Pro aminopeptidase [Pseudomonadales bacterium]
MTQMEALDQREFGRRRETLAAQLAPNSVAIIASAGMVNRNSDVDYLFRQNSDFFYLTGFDEPDATALIIKGEQEVSYHLFCQPRDPDMEIWFGYRNGESGVLEHYAADVAYSSELRDEKMPQLLDGVNLVYYSFAREDLSGDVQGWLKSMRSRRRQGVIAPPVLRQLDDMLHEMRLFKSAAEQQLMRRAGEISAQAHLLAMQVCKPGVTEYQLESHIQHCFSMNGCQQAAYPSIVGGGKNACVLHYIENKCTLQDGDLVLIDAGCEHHYYAGDITRTFPVNGVFSEEQRALYQIVLQTQLSCIEMVTPGTPWEAIHDNAVRMITEGLVGLGLLEGSVDEAIKSGTYRAFFMHKLGHWLGMDVHDVGDYKVDGQWRELAAGMVMTVEPGIYVAADNQSVDPKWRGIGIRIEDDVLVTDKGCEILTAGVPKTIEEIERVMAQA